MKSLCMQLYYNQLWYAGRILLMPLLVGFVFGWWWKPLWMVVAALFIFLLYFFRVPVRDITPDDVQVVSPADGRIVAIQPAVRNAQAYTRISIFLSPLDVHVNWIPVNSRIREIVYTPGKFVVAWAEKSSEINERLELTLETTQGTTLYVRQIAGFVARRIWCKVQVGQELSRGQLYGMIRFGSRVDILVPADSKIVVQRGMRVVGCKTILGILP